MCSPFASLPQLGQHLIHKSLSFSMTDPGMTGMTSSSAASSMTTSSCFSNPPRLLHSTSFTDSLMAQSMKSHDPFTVLPSGVRQQADLAVRRGAVKDRELEQEHSKGLVGRRERQKDAVGRSRARRELLEARAGQRAENAHAMAVKFYEGVHGEVSLTVGRATDVEMADANGSDPVCKIHFQDRPVVETTVKWNTLNPVWNEKFTYTFTSPDDLKSEIKVEVYDQDPSDQEYLGETTVHLSTLTPRREQEIVADLQKASTGTIHLTVVVTPVSVMIERKEEELKAEKDRLAESKSPRLEKEAAAEASRQLMSAGSGRRRSVGGGRRGSEGGGRTRRRIEGGVEGRLNATA